LEFFFSNFLFLFLKKVWNLGSKEVFNSQGWLNMSSGGILEYLGSHFCLMKMVDQVWGLIRWGKFQLQKQNKTNLRSQILPGLQKIRFDYMSLREIAELFKEELGQVLTGDEKYSIFMANIEKTQKPLGFGY
jgi:hypothetical protein